MTTTLIDTFVEKLRTPDFFDFAGGTTSASDTFLKQLGVIANKVQSGALTAGDAQSVKTTLTWFSEVINRMNTQLANVAPSASADTSLARYLKALASKTNLAFQQLSYATDEIISGHSTSVQKFRSETTTVSKQASAFLGFVQIAVELNGVYILAGELSVLITQGVSAIKRISKHYENRSITHVFLLSRRHKKREFCTRQFYSNNAICVILI
jgi:hypothetical protein